MLRLLLSNRHSALPSISEYVLCLYINCITYVHIRLFVPIPA